MRWHAVSNATAKPANAVTPNAEPLHQLHAIADHDTQPAQVAVALDSNRFCCGRGGRVLLFPLPQTSRVCAFELNNVDSVSVSKWGLSSQNVSQSAGKKMSPQPLTFSIFFCFTLCAAAVVRTPTGTPTPQAQWIAVYSGVASEQHTAATIGPVKWMAPEQLERMAYSRASDVFAFGVLLYEIFARSAPWPGLANVNVITQVVMGKRMELPKSIPHEVREAMKQCWAQEAAERPKITAVVDELREALTKAEVKGNDATD